VKAVILAVLGAPPLVARHDAAAELPQHADAREALAPDARRIGERDIADAAADGLGEQAAAIARWKDSLVGRPEPMGRPDAEPAAPEGHTRRQAGVVGVLALTEKVAQAAAADPIEPVMRKLRARPGGNPSRHAPRRYHGASRVALTTTSAESLMPTMASSLRSALNDLASNFAASVLNAIQGASLEDLLGEAGAPRRGPGRPRRTPSMGGGKPARAARGGRLKRRSPEDIAQALDQVVTLVKKSKEGLRAEQIRAQLGMQPKEMPRVLKEGLSTKKLSRRARSARPRTRRRSCVRAPHRAGMRH
jgi:hypothetical protein